MTRENIILKSSDNTEVDRILYYFIRIIKRPNLILITITCVEFEFIDRFHIRIQHFLSEKLIIKF
jgi:hypothetical protein